MFMRLENNLTAKVCFVLVLNLTFTVYSLIRKFYMNIIEIDRTHNPEFTSCEIHLAYTDYNKMMGLTEAMISGELMHVHCQCIYYICYVYRYTFNFFYYNRNGDGTKKRKQI